MLKGEKIRAFLVGGGILLLMVLLSACGYNGTTVGSQPSTPPTPTPTAQPPVVRNCGMVHTIRDLVVPTEGSTAKQELLRPGLCSLSSCHIDLFAKQPGHGHHS